MELHKQPASVRLIAVQVLRRVLEKKHKADIAMEQLGVNLDSRDRGLLHELVLGVLRHFYILEADFSRFLKQKPDAEARMTLFLGTYQLRYMRVPKHAAVSECVNVIKLLQPKASGMINAVLRKVAVEDVPRKFKPYQRAGIPNWLYKNWRDAFGSDVVQEFTRVLQTPAHICVAVFVSREAWLEEVLGMGIEAEKGEFSPYAVLLEAGVNITSLPGFDTGGFTVMDQAAQMAVLALEAPEHGLILDVCAAPGGKTALLAHRFPKARIIAVELNSKRIPRLKQNLLRLQCNNVSIIQADALCLPILENSADAIFLDAPCSASGILRRHPDAKFLHDEEAVKALAIVQRKIVLSCLKALKKEASLVYAVCSINPQENEQILEGLDVIDSKRILPTDIHDGFFWAKLNK